MKILILTNNDVGLYKFRRELLEELVKKYKVYVSVPDGEYFDNIKTIGCKVIADEILDRRGTNPLQDIKLVWHYNHIIRKVNPKIVLTYTIKPNVYGGVVCRWYHVPYIANITGLGTSIENGGLLQKLTKMLYRIGLCRAQEVFFQNIENRNYFLKHKVIKNHCDVLPGSGVNTDQHCYEPYPDENETLIFSTIGRIMKNKGIDEILSAAKVIKREAPQIQFQLIGYFDEDYKDVVIKAEKEGLIKYIEHQKDIHPIMAKSHAIIHASYHEGMSNVLLEAASTGRPVIATNVPGCKETFDEGITGIGFEARNSRDLIRAIRIFIRLSHVEKEAMGKAGREKMKREFSRDIVIRKYMQEINRIAREE